MFSLKLVNFSVLLFYVVLYTKADKYINKQVDQFDKLLMYSGWKNLNVVKFVKYKNKTYFLENLIETPSRRSLFMVKVRALTIYLGCTYAKVINTISSIIVNCLKICTKNKERNVFKNNIYLYTEGFINILTIFIIPVVTLMKGAMDALDSIHFLPWAYFKENCNQLVMSTLLKRIGNIFDKLNERTLSRNQISTYTWAFITIYSFSNRTIEDIKYETEPYCEFVPYNQNYLWNEWIQEYNDIIKQDEKLVFLNFLTRKLKDYINIVIIENYFQLGFKFDPITEETFLTSSKEPIIQELELKATDEEPPTLLQIETH